MKKPFSWMVLLFFGATALTLQHCTDDGESAAPEKIQFTLGFSEVRPDGGRSQITAIPDVLLLSVTNSSGQTIFLNKRVNLIRMGDSFITEPLEMTPASHYLITDFMLINDEAGVIYATPRQGSPLAKAVNHPLPYPFAVTKNKVTNISMEVIDVTARQPEDFGYVSFPINAVNPLEVAVLIPSGSSTSLTSAKAYIVEGGDTVKQFNLSATVNIISFPGDPLVPRKLIVTKSGYNAEVKEFVYTDLIAELNGLPWNITLTPSVFTLIPWHGRFEMTLEGQPGALSVDWGDGTSNVYALSPGGVLVDHTYGSVGTYPVTITGDLDKIEYLYNFYGAGAVKALNLQGLTALKEIRMGYTDCPAIIDFSHNHKLEYVMMPVALQLKTLILPENSIIRYLEISGTNQMMTADIDNVIDQVYAGAVANHTLNGIFFLYIIYNVTDVMLGPPSPDRINKLRDLRDNYGWHHTPDPL